MVQLIAEGIGRVKGDEEGPSGPCIGPEGAVWTNNAGVIDYDPALRGTRLAAFHSDGHGRADKLLAIEEHVDHVLAHSKEAELKVAATMHW